jgi:quercetin dioxygenase-like cupin family protein
MKVTKVSQGIVKANPHKVDTRLLYDKESAQAVHIQLNPGEALKPHITPVDVFFYILEGTPTIHVGDEKQTLEPDTLVESPKGIVHFISNDTNRTARILVVKAPKPVGPTKLL